MSKKILLVDGHSILNRAFYGLPMLTTSKGLHTNAVYGFLNILFKEIEEEQPDFLAVAFDLAKPTFRHEMYSAYKGTRKPMPAELHEQVPMIKEVLTAMGVSVVTLVGYEADDIIGTMSLMAENAGDDAVILSGDRDLLQLVSGNVTLKLPKTSKGTTTVEVFTPDRVIEVYGITPIQVIDLKAMMGDSSDNIPGLPGVGEKTATVLVQKYGTLENAHDNVDEITPKKAQNAMREHYDLGELSKSLATINRNAPLDKKYDDCVFGELYTKEAYELFKEYEFKNFLSRFDDSSREMSVVPEVDIVRDFSETEKFLDALEKCGRFAFELNIRENAIDGVAFATENGITYIPVSGFITESYLSERISKAVKLANEVSTIGLKEALSFIEAKQGIFDVEVAAYLLNPIRNEYSYDYIALEYLHMTLKSQEEIVGAKITKKTEFTEEQIASIYGNMAFTAFKSRSVLLKRLDEAGMLKLYEEIEDPLIYTLADMERRGILVERATLKEISNELAGGIEKEEKTIYELAGVEFNIQSPKQLGEILFEKLHLKGGKKTKTGYSTAADVLEKLASEAPIVENVLNYRQLAKLKSTYADALGDYIASDGRIHTDFKQTVTATGRLSSVEPNLQNIPVRNEYGRVIRKVFVPKEGCVFIDADYSQIELRILAHMSGDEKLITAYNQAKDIHAITASEVFGVSIEEVTSEMRRNAKAVNFGIVYGISSFGLSQGLSISRKDAARYIDKYFVTYPDIKRFLDSLVAFAKKNGYAETIFGRRRPIPELKSGNFMQRSFGERVAMNAPIQGTAADIIKIAMNNVARRLETEKMASRLILQVHDELLVEAPVEEVEKASVLLREEMENAVQLKVKLEADVKTGTNWAEAH